MLKALLFKFINVLLFFSKKNFYVISKYKFVDDEETVHITYIYNNKQYVYIGPESSFPPPINPGFVPCIISAYTMNEGRNVTDIVKRCAGPKNDFYGLPPPDPKYIIGTRFVPRFRFDISYDKISFHLKPIVYPSKKDDECIVVKNIFNQISVLGKT